MLTGKMVKLALVPAFLIAANLHAQTITLQLQAPSTTDLNDRIGGVAGFSVSYVPDQYRVYATTSLPRGRWKNNTTHRDYFLESLTVGSAVYYEADSCYVGKDPRFWNRRCIDAIGVFTKRVACTTSPTYACSTNDYWNAYPGRSNMSTFPVRPPLDDSGFGWPSNTAWGVKNFTPILDKATLYAAQPSPPRTNGAEGCHPTNVSELATGVANSKVAQVKFSDGTSRWFMVYNSQIHKESSGTPPGFNGEDVWRVQWAYSADGYQWNVENRPLFLDSSETNGWCSTGLLVTDMFVDNGYFYIIANRITNPNIYLFRSPVDQFSTPGYNLSRGWEVRGAPDPVTGLYQWIPVVPLGSHINFDMIGATTIIPSRFSSFGGVIRQTAIARVFASSQPNSASRYLALTLDQSAQQAAVVQLWASDDLNRAFTYQSDVANVPAGGYGYEFSFTHHPDNVPATPRLYDNDLEIWFVHAVACEGIPSCCEGPSCAIGTQPPPSYRAQSYFTVSRRRARLIGGIYGS